MYEFRHRNLSFGKGTLAELIAYDRYSISTTETSLIKVGDAVLFKQEQKKQLVGTVINLNYDYGMLTIEAHDGSGEYGVALDKVRVVKEKMPAEMWDRWAKGAASVEGKPKRKRIENEFRELLDGFKYVPGGRIMSMLGREFSKHDGRESKLSAYNCLVLPSPDCSSKKSSVKNWLEIIRIAKKEANSMAFGCGVGINISTVPEEIEGPMHRPVVSVSYSLSDAHTEYKDIQENTFKHMMRSPETPPYGGTYKIIVKDSRSGIFDALTEMVQVLYGTNEPVSVDFSDLRAKGAYVKGIDGASSGAISWMKLFDFVVGMLKKDFVDVVDVAEFYALIPNLISQGGQRRGALMLVLNVDHVHIVRFIQAKQEAGRITGANLSINLTKKFMDDLDKGSKEQEIFDMIAYYAHKTGEPGVLFMDTVNVDSNTRFYQVIDAVNPCAEEPLPPNGVCNLGHHNLPMYLTKENGKYELDYEALKKSVHAAVRFQDNIIDYTGYFNEDIKAVQMGDRRIGIGTMGLATVLIKLGLRYGSQEAEEFADSLYRFIAFETYMASIALGKEKGSYLKYNCTEIPESSFLYRITDGNLPSELRNAAIITQAPTGSTGTMIDNIPGYNCSTGVEPYYAFEYYRAGRLGVEKQEVGLVNEWRQEHPERDLPSYFVTSQSITPTEHVRMQSTIQTWVDAAISKTINLPNDASVLDVKEAYYAAYYGGCKGVTVYRDGSRAGQVLATKKEDAKLEDDKVFVPLSPMFEAPSTVKAEPVNLVSLESFDTLTTNGRVNMPESFRKRSRRIYGQTIKQNTPMGKMYVTINSGDDGSIEEIFLHLGKIGSDVRAITDALGILLTLSLSERLNTLTQGEKLTWIINKLIGIKGANPIGMGPNRVDSLPDALGRVLREYVESMADEVESVYDTEKETFEDHFAGAPISDICPSCGNASIVKVEGCQTCTVCGDSKCS